MAIEFHIWIIDDKRENITMIERSFPAEVRKISAVRSFLKAREALACFDTLVGSADDHLPDFILLDFFLDPMYGHHLLDQFLERYQASGYPRAVIIAHSSMSGANMLLLKHGADCALEKVKGQEQSRAVASAFRSIDAIRWFKQHRIPLPEP
jgi:CheY-like chemotaxis protein